MKTFPLYNINGSSPESMAEAYSKVLVAIDAAHAAMRQVTPHGRDYQPNPPVYLDALKEHMDRLHALDVIYADFERLFHDALAGGRDRGIVD